MKRSHVTENISVLLKILASIEKNFLVLGCIQHLQQMHWDGNSPPHWEEKDCVGFSQGERVASTDFMETVDFFFPRPSLQLSDCLKIIHFKITLLKCEKTALAYVWKGCVCFRTICEYDLVNDISNQTMFTDSNRAVIRWCFFFLINHLCFLVYYLLNSVAGI